MCVLNSKKEKGKNKDGSIYIYILTKPAGSTTPTIALSCNTNPSCTTKPTAFAFLFETGLLLLLCFVKVK